MSDVSMDRFAKAFGLDEKGASEPFVWGTVTAVRSDGSYTVTVGGTTNTARAAKLCHAAVGDRVLCALRGGTLCAIATVGGGTVPVSGGGTGAATAAAARTNLGITPANIGAVAVGSMGTLESLELGYGATTGHGGYVDFHYNGSSADYTSRIIESSSGHLSVEASGGIGVNSRIARGGGGSWIGSRNNVAVYGSSCGQSSGSSYNVCAGQATNSGVWTMGNLSGDERLCFAYTTDSDYSAGNNRTGATVYMPVKGGELALNWQYQTRRDGGKGTSSISIDLSGWNEVLLYAYTVRSSDILISSAIYPVAQIESSAKEYHLAGSGNGSAIGTDWHGNISLTSLSLTAAAINGTDYVGSTAVLVYVR